VRENPAQADYIRAMLQVIDTFGWTRFGLLNGDCSLASASTAYQTVLQNDTILGHVSFVQLNLFCEYILRNYFFSLCARAHLFLGNAPCPK
jgi:hypothetical protein